MERSATPPHRRVVYQAAFEALLRGVQAESNPSLVRALAAAGYTAARPNREYPTELLLRVLELLADRCFPAMARDDAYEQLGRQAFQGYRATLVGRVVMAALHLASVPQALQLAVRGFQSVTNYAVHEVLPVAPQHLIYRVHHLLIPPHYTLGLLKELLAGSGHKALTFRVDSAAAPAYVDFHVQW
ncbi:MAG: DUF2378 family protein [Chloroflexota bacterium]|nr:DUF2378 family protein [Chloroflexota bacterium]